MSTGERRVSQFWQEVGTGQRDLPDTAPHDWRLTMLDAVRDHPVDQAAAIAGVPLKWVLSYAERNHRYRAALRRAYRNEPTTPAQVLAGAATRRRSKT